MDASKKIRQMAQAMQATARKLPRMLGTEIVRYSNQRFTEQGWDGKPWKDRKNPLSKKNGGRAILIKSGRLRRGIRMTSVSFTSVTVGVNLPYAAAHNNGFKGIENVRAHQRKIKYKSQFTDLSNTDGTGKRGKKRVRTQVYQTDVKAHSRNMRMPQRQFLGDSPYLRRNLLRITTAAFNTALKPYLNTP
jgi:phage gpG-like protein